MAAELIQPLAGLSIRGATASSLTALCGRLLNQTILAGIELQNRAAGKHTAYSGQAPANKSGVLQWQTYENYYSALAERDLQRARQRQPGLGAAAEPAPAKGARGRAKADPPRARDSHNAPPPDARVNPQSLCRPRLRRARRQRHCFSHGPDL